MIEIVLYGPFREAVGRKTVEHEYVPGSTVRSTLRDLAEAYPALDDQLFSDGELRSTVTVLKNGENIKTLSGELTPLREDDRVSVTVPLEGG